MADNLLQVRLAVTRTKQGVSLWCSELWRNGELYDASEWTTSVVDAIRDGRDLEGHARSDIAFREARAEAAQLFQRAS